MEQRQIYESLTRDHPSYTTTPMWFWGWSYKRDSTVQVQVICDSLARQWSADFFYQLIFTVPISDQHIMSVIDLKLIWHSKLVAMVSLRSVLLRSCPYTLVGLTCWAKCMKVNGCRRRLCYILDSVLCFVWLVFPVICADRDSACVTLQADVSAFVSWVSPCRI